MRSLSVLLALALVGAGMFVFLFRPYSPGDPPRIPTGWGQRRSPAFVGEAATANPIDTDLPERNPSLASTNSSNMHADSSATDAHVYGGPLGENPTVTTYSHAAIGGECACVTFDSRANILAVCATFRDFALMLLSPDDLRPLARLTLPPRESNRSLNLRRIMSDTSGGAYFFLDDQDRAVLVDADQRLIVVEQDWSGEQVELQISDEFDLLPYLMEHSLEGDVITSTLPDWEGRYWFVSREGLVGVLDPIDGTLTSLVLDDEEIQNSFAIDAYGVYVVSDKALYGIEFDEEQGIPRVVWREEYEISSVRKLGSITTGSGTTPTLLGEEFVAIADNAEERINVLVYRRRMEYEADRLVCKVPVFEPGRSATENTLIGVGNSLIIENNYGYDLFVNMIFGRSGEGGVARVDFDPLTNTGEVVWVNPIISQTTVPKLSLETGLIYVYAKDPSIGWGIDAYYLAALDFTTGETVYRVLTGTGIPYDNNWAPITLGENGVAYVGVFRGLIRVADTVNEYE